MIEWITTDQLEDFSFLEFQKNVRSIIATLLGYSFTFRKDNRIIGEIVGGEYEVQEFAVQKALFARHFHHINADSDYTERGIFHLEENRFIKDDPQLYGILLRLFSENVTKIEYQKKQLHHSGLLVEKSVTIRRKMIMGQLYQFPGGLTIDIHLLGERYSIDIGIVSANNDERIILSEISKKIHKAVSHIKRTSSIS